MTDDHLDVLSRALAQLIDDRRIYAAKLASQSQPEERERWRPMFVQIQDAIRAVEAAIEDEKKLGGTGDGDGVEGSFDTIFSLSK